MAEMDERQIRRRSTSRVQRCESGQGPIPAHSLIETYLSTARRTSSSASCSPWCRSFAASGFAAFFNHLHVKGMWRELVRRKYRRCAAGSHAVSKRPGLPFCHSQCPYLDASRRGRPGRSRQTSGNTYNPTEPYTCIFLDTSEIRSSPQSRLITNGHSGVYAAASCRLSPWSGITSPFSSRSPRYAAWCGTAQTSAGPRDGGRGGPLSTATVGPTPQ